MAMFSLNLKGFEPEPSVPEENVMFTAPRRQGVWIYVLDDFFALSTNVG
jgi:hypothetical protein